MIFSKLLNIFEKHIKIRFHSKLKISERIENLIVGINKNFDYSMTLKNDLLNSGINESVARFQEIGKTLKLRY